ncbi:MAG: hypothetical protein JKZ00_05730 [Flavobacteriaceae bacterium]|nr:hypothetical protein [Flavobacteriaceae bacterium]
MKKLNLLLGFVIISAITIGCDNKSCEEGYTEFDDNFCLPDYVVGIEPNSELDNKYYHSKYGVITYKNNKWYKENNSIIKNINN